MKKPARTTFNVRHGYAVQVKIVRDDGIVVDSETIPAVYPSEDEPRLWIAPVTKADALMRRQPLARPTAQGSRVLIIRINIAPPPKEEEEA